MAADAKRAAKKLAGKLYALTPAEQGKLLRRAVAIKETQNSLYKELDGILERLIAGGCTATVEVDGVEYALVDSFEHSNKSWKSSAFSRFDVKEVK